MKLEVNNEVLKVAVLQSRMTLADIASKARINAGTISRLLNEVGRTCTLRTIQRLCDALNIEPTALAKI